MFAVSRRRWEDSENYVQGYVKIIAELKTFESGNDFGYDPDNDNNYNNDNNKTYIHYEYSYGSCCGCDEWEARKLNSFEIEREMYNGMVFMDKEALLKYVENMTSTNGAFDSKIISPREAVNIFFEKENNNDK